MICPKCTHIQKGTTECEKCGVLFGRIKNRELRKINKEIEEAISFTKNAHFITAENIYNQLLKNETVVNDLRLTNLIKLKIKSNAKARNKHTKREVENSLEGKTLYDNEIKKSYLNNAKLTIINLFNFIKDKIFVNFFKNNFPSRKIIILCLVSFFILSINIGYIFFKIKEINMQKQYRKEKIVKEKINQCIESCKESAAVSFQIKKRIMISFSSDGMSLDDDAQSRMVSSYYNDLSNCKKSCISNTE